jgi:hypothetical protein
MDGGIYSKDDPIYVALWKALVHHATPNAAAGLLEDVIGQLVWGQVVCLDGLARRDEADGGPVARADVADVARASLREQLMIILSDRDGGRLGEWVALYQSDRAAFREEAIDWFETCRNADVRLFG